MGERKNVKYTAKINFDVISYIALYYTNPRTIIPWMSRNKNIYIYISQTKEKINSGYSPVVFVLSQHSLYNKPAQYKS